ncbi:hypothetical protein D3C72_2252850 [compost metagenome]
MATLLVPAGRSCQLSWGEWFSPLQPKPLKLSALSISWPSWMSVLFKVMAAAGRAARHSRESRAELRGNFMVVLLYE